MVSLVVSNREDREVRNTKGYSSANSALPVASNSLQRCSCTTEINELSRKFSQLQSVLNNEPNTQNSNLPL